MAYVSIDVERLLRRLLAAWHQGVLLFYHVFFWEVIVFWIRLLGIDRWLQAQEPRIQRAAARWYGKYTTHNGEQIEFSLAGLIDPHFDAPREYAPAADFPVTQHTQRYGPPLDHPINLHFCVYAARLSFEDERIIGDVVTHRWGCTMHAHRHVCCARARGGGGAPAALEEIGWYCFSNKRAVVVVFRGTDPLSIVNWETDFNAGLHKQDGCGGVHAGFWAALFNPLPGAGDCVFDQVHALLRTLLTAGASDGGRLLFLAGHSLGGALTSVFAQALRARDPRLAARVGGIYTYGQPRVGDDEYVDLFFAAYAKRCFRCVYAADVVPRVPPAIGFVHTPLERYVPSFDLATARVLKVEAHADDIEEWRRFELGWAYLLSLIKLALSPFTETSWRTAVRLLFILVPSFSDHVDYEGVLKRYMRKSLAEDERGGGWEVVSPAAKQE